MRISNWSNGTFWSTGSSPSPANDVTIYSDGNDLVTLDVGSTNINSLVLGGAAVAAKWASGAGDRGAG